MLKSLCGVFISLIALSALAREETSGQWVWSAPYFDLGYQYREGRVGEMNLNGLQFGGYWSLGDPNQPLLGQTDWNLSLGTKSQLNRPLRYENSINQTVGTDLTLLDAAVDYRGHLGEIRIGLQPVRFGLENGRHQDRLWLPSLVDRKRIIGWRDWGLSYRVTNEGIDSHFLIHNGEGSSDLDHELWYTMGLEYQIINSRSVTKIGLSGQVGRTAPSSTLPTSSTNATMEIAPGEAAKYRFASLYWQSVWEIGEGNRDDGLDRRFTVETEIFFAETQQEHLSHRSRSSRLETSFEPSLQYGLFARYDTFDTDLQIAGGLEQEIQVGVEIHPSFAPSHNRTRRSSRFFIAATKAMLEGRSADEHRFDLAFRFTPDF